MSPVNFRETVAQVAARAKAILPPSVNGRIESAVKLVLAHDVTPQEDGSIDVGSRSDPLKQYHLEGTTCDCQDFTRGQAPDGWCAHRIAAGIARRVGEVLAAAPPARQQPAPAEDPWPDPEDGEACEVEGEPWPDQDPAPAAAAPPAPALPEAPVSITLKGFYRGQDVLVTLRGVDFASVRSQVEQAAQWLDAPAAPRAPAAAPGLSPEQHNAAAMHTPVAGFCPVHNVQMTLNTGKDGRQWYSHRTPDGFCKGR